jgi:hypothetical protein
MDGFLIASIVCGIVGVLGFVIVGLVSVWQILGRKCPSTKGTVYDDPVRYTVTLLEGNTTDMWKLLRSFHNIGLAEAKHMVMRLPAVILPNASLLDTCLFINSISIREPKARVCITNNKGNQQLSLNEWKEMQDGKRKETK